MAGSVRIKNRIQEYRERLGMARDQLAEELNISDWYLGKLERQEFSPGLDIMIRICTYFDREVNEVFYIDRGVEESLLE